MGILNWHRQDDDSATVAEDSSIDRSAKKVYGTVSEARE